jgi:hypothetical protein
MVYQINAGEVIGVRRGGVRVVAERDTLVEVNFDQALLSRLVRKAALSKRGRAISGPVAAKVRKAAAK